MGAIAREAGGKERHAENNEDSVRNVGSDGLEENRGQKAKRERKSTLQGGEERD